jgi:hypothetical protein
MRPVIIIQLNGLAVTYDKEVTKDMITIWEAVLSDLTDEEIRMAVTAYVRSDKGHFPRPGQIYSLVKPQENEDHEAILITERIMSQIGPNGGDSAFNCNRAKMRIGEVGWRYITEYRSGWSAFCNSFDENTNLEVAKSQIRKALVGLLIQKNSSMSMIDNENEQPRSLRSFGIEMKSVGSKNGSIDLSED